MTVAVSLIPIAGMPLIHAGADLAGMIMAALDAGGLALSSGDVLVLAQKIVSKAEGRLIPLANVTASAAACDLAARCGKDPRLVELILAETEAVMRVREGVLIVRHRLGLVLANAGIDQSNVDQTEGEVALLLPKDPDESCRRLRAILREATGKQVGVLMVDSLGRAWRNGTVGTAIGASGLPALLDLRGRNDLHGRALQTSELGFADEIAAAASLVMGQSDEAIPAVLVRGLALGAAEGSARDLIRPQALDLFP